MENKKVYVVMRYWYDFEDDECNGCELEEIYDNFYSAKQKAISLVIDEIDKFSEVDEQFGKNKPTLEDLLDNLDKYLDKYKVIYLKTKYSWGKTKIEIIEREVKNND